MNVTDQNIAISTFLGRPMPKYSLNEAWDEYPPTGRPNYETKVTFKLSHPDPDFHSLVFHCRKSELSKQEIKDAFAEEYLPNYCDDLNACHEMENALDGYMMFKYATELMMVMGGEGTGGSFSHIHAPARKRAEAFLRTIGKWKRGKKS